ncbi:aldo/keto reductase [Campylobacter showae]|uniref:aldo/keto reductase n=1 Tax=Campylobacter showae TaxID=204 RepID=UPI000F074053|nr:aldo/keto reductase [Campylobacter showae]
MKRREFIKGAATCAVGLATGVNLFAERTIETSAANLTDGVDLSGAKNLGEKLAAMTPYLTLNNRILMPIIGLSADKFDGSKDQNALETALGLGYRLIDTEGDKEEVAATAFAASDLERGQLFIQSSVGAQNADKNGMIKSFERSLKKLNTDYVDLLLLRVGASDASSAWRVLQRLYREGLAAAIGICDRLGEFGIENLAKIAQGSEVKPAVYQTPARSYLRHFVTRGKLTDHGVQVQLRYEPGEELKEAAIAQIGEKYSKTRTQIILRWLVQHGVCVIVNAGSKERLLENIDIFGFELADEDAAQIAKLWRS